MRTPKEACIKSDRKCIASLPLGTKLVGIGEDNNLLAAWEQEVAYPFDSCNLSRPVSPVSNTKRSEFTK
ncbi:UNVERIFIED_CONTAM: hypothetical protein Slati_2982300 [Sesamum latifolium]|uniref:Uncharacterized protein n=1 Tax=Sesamum latifolium TaxID=2727402 RepID=A0AAW2VGG7_9LAMI